MRDTFIRTLTGLADRDPRILLLTADLGYTVLEKFADVHSDRFFNVGVAEQNMIGLGTGLAEAGFIPFLYSIATFAALRPYEFIRNGPVLHNLPARIVGVGGGFEYGSAGPTHHALEDIAALRVFPALTIVAPADFEQTRTALEATWDLPGPVYYRLGKNEKQTVPGLGGRFETGRAQSCRHGNDVVIVCMGGIAIEAAAAAELLAARGISVELVIVASVNPAPTEDLISILSRFSIAVTVEAHYISGGIGSIVAETIADNGISCRLTRCGVSTPADGRSGSEAFMNHLHGISRSGIAASVEGAVAGSANRK